MILSLASAAASALLSVMVAPAVAPASAPAPAAPQEILLWPEGAPAAVPNAPPEHVEDGRVYAVSRPTLTVWSPPAGTANGTAVIVCPGGGYVRLAVDKEGSQVSRWLTGIGVTVFLLKYRVAPHRHPAPLLDVLRAVRLVRSRAGELGVDPRRIGVMGSSAGGHLAASAGTLFAAAEGRTGAALDAVSARPDFLVLQYPVITMKDPHAHAGSRRALIGDGAAPELVARTSLELQVTAETPPAFLVHTQEDRSVPAENSLLFYRALSAVGVPAELHLYPKGPHGFGLQAGLGTTSEWPRRCEEWMRAQGWLPPPTPPRPGHRPHHRRRNVRLAAVLETAMASPARPKLALLPALWLCGSLGCASMGPGVGVSTGAGGAGVGPGGAAVAGTGGATATGGNGGDHWVATWATGPQLTEPGNLPPAPGLAENTLRQVVYVSIGGSRLRVRLCNAYGNGPVTMRSVHLALSSSGSDIMMGTDQALTFSGTESVTIPAGASLWSDALSFSLPPLTKVAITIAFGGVPSDVTGHPGSRTTSFLQSGDMAGVAILPSPVTTEHWYFITGIDVMADASTSAIVVLGDSITDGRGSTTDGNNRWPDNLSRRLQASMAAAKVAVLNLGIGGNAVLTGGLGPTAVQRFESDVLGQSGARWLIVLEGVNDIGASAGPAVAANLIAAFGRFVDMAHARGMRAYGVPILPFGGNGYGTPEHETARQTVNDWIRTGGKFDAVIDLDAAVRDPANPTNLSPAYDGGDHLHLNVAGYQKMGDAIDLALFGG